MPEKRKFDKETEELIDNFLGKKAKGEKSIFYDFLYEKLKNFPYNGENHNSETSKLKLIYETNWPKFKDHYNARHIEDVLEAFEESRNQNALPLQF